MMNIFWAGFTNDERLSAITKIQDVVSKFGDIVDIHLFSDLSLSLTIEVQEFKIDRLHEDLGKIIGLEKPDYLNSISNEERTIYLNITFAKGTGNLKVEVPSVPG
jgi:hypothetical protein